MSETVFSMFLDYDVQTQEYIVDVSSMSEYETLGGYEKLGGKAYLVDTGGTPWLRTTRIVDHAGRK